MAEVDGLAFKINHEEEKCIGCGACVSVCPDNWEMAENKKGEPKAKPKKKEVDDVSCNKEAESVCPTNCIHVEEE